MEELLSNHSKNLNSIIQDIKKLRKEHGFKINDIEINEDSSGNSNIRYSINID